MINKIFTAATVLTLCFLSLPTYAENPEQICKALLDRTVHVWTMAPISEGVKTYAAKLHIDPLRIRGDFDGDGREDIALLIQNRSQPVFEEPSRINATRVAVCLAKKPLMILRLIEKPYCDDYIYLMKRGNEIYDVEAGSLGKYPVDAIGTVCFEKAGAVFIFDGKNFRQIINSD